MTPIIIIHFQNTQNKVASFFCQDKAKQGTKKKGAGCIKGKGGQP